MPVTNSTISLNIFKKLFTFTSLSTASISNTDVCAVILGAGKGTRMKSKTPKVLSKVNGMPLILYPIQNLKSIGVGQIITVVKYKKREVLNVLDGLSDFAIQKNKYGTAIAVESSLYKVRNDISHIMVINGDDSIFYTNETFNNVVKKHKSTGSTITFISVKKDNPKGFGRVVYDENGNFKKIVEEKDASVKEKKIKEVNDGVYLFEKNFLLDNITKIKKSETTGEYYLTSIIEIAIKKNLKVSTYLLEDSNEFFGISTKEDLIAANLISENKKN
jgi:bifunctional UDP-N-acetylglucosamine pyrophosphorylase/glucosamine-1-phosphate N-acetyltransferase